MWVVVTTRFSHSDDRRCSASLGDDRLLHRCAFSLVCGSYAAIIRCSLLAMDKWKAKIALWIVDRCRLVRRYVSQREWSIGLKMYLFLAMHFSSQLVLLSLTRNICWSSRMNIDLRALFLILVPKCSCIQMSMVRTIGTTWEVALVFDFFHSRQSSYNTRQWRKRRLPCEANSTLL